MIFSRPNSVCPEPVEGLPCFPKVRKRGSASTSSAQTVICILAIGLLTTPVLAKDRLGAWQSWAAFKDPETPRCYAIGAPDKSSGDGGYLSVGFWPKRKVGHQLYVHLSRERSANAGITLSAGGRRFRLETKGNSGWAKDRAMDMAIIAAMRSSNALSIESIGKNGGAIVDAYALRGAASAIDAAALGCVER